MWTESIYFWTRIVFHHYYVIRSELSTNIWSLVAFCSSRCGQRRDAASCISFYWYCLGAVLPTIATCLSLTPGNLPSLFFDLVRAVDECLVARRVLFKQVWSRKGYGILHNILLVLPRCGAVTDPVTFRNVSKQQSVKAAIYLRLTPGNQLPELCEIIHSTCLVHLFYQSHTQLSRQEPKGLTPEKAPIDEKYHCGTAAR
jgi:hypothetical protein